MSKSSVLLTGATGFIGRHCLTALLQQGYEVHATYRHDPLLIDNVHWHQLDILDSSATDKLLRDINPSNLLHMAWFVKHGEFWTSELNYDFVSASLKLLQSFAKHGGKRVVVSGTCAEYDWRYGYCVENVTPCTPHTTYGVCKANLFQLGRQYAQDTGLSYAWGRIFFPYGPYEKSSRLIPYVIQSLLKNEPAQTTSGEQIRDFMYINDLADAFVALLTSDIQGAINITSGQPMRLKDMILMIADVLDKHHLIQLGAHADGTQPTMIVGDISRLQNEVGWQPTYSTKQGIEATIQWWQNQLQKNR